MGVGEALRTHDLPGNGVRPDHQDIARSEDLNDRASCWLFRPPCYRAATRAAVASARSCRPHAGVAAGSGRGRGGSGGAGRDGRTGRKRRAQQHRHHQSLGGQPRERRAQHLGREGPEVRVAGDAGSRTGRSRSPARPGSATRATSAATSARSGRTAAPCSAPRRSASRSAPRSPSDRRPGGRRPARDARPARRGPAATPATAKPTRWATLEAIPPTTRIPTSESARFSCSEETSESIRGYCARPSNPISAQAPKVSTSPSRDGDDERPPPTGDQQPDGQRPGEHLGRDDRGQRERRRPDPSRAAATRPRRPSSRNGPTAPRKSPNTNGQETSATARQRRSVTPSRRRPAEHRGDAGQREQRSGRPAQRQQRQRHDQHVGQRRVDRDREGMVGALADRHAAAAHDRGLVGQEARAIRAVAVQDRPAGVEQPALEVVQQPVADVGEGSADQQQLPEQRAARPTSSTRSRATSSARRGGAGRRERRS